MEINKPQLILVKNSSNTFELLSITFCDKFNVEADTSNSIITPANADGVVKVKVNATVNENVSQMISSFNCVNPIVHRINLGNNVQEDLESDEQVIIGEIEVTFNFTDSGTGLERHGGRSKVKHVAAGGQLRPIEG